MGGALIATLFFVPLLAYAVAGVSHLVARAMGGQGTYLGARMALFWSLLAVGPLMLLQGLLRGLVGPGPALTVVGLGVLAAFLALWINALIEAERG
jgi:Na+-transporting methylmalonyl-CoA/oxaloacetate decarboxylase gamma subunit